MTNREKINQMSNEELADFIHNKNFYCNYYCIHTKEDCNCCSYFDFGCFIKWLESEVEE